MSGSMNGSSPAQQYPKSAASPSYPANTNFLWRTQFRWWIPDQVTCYDQQTVRPYKICPLQLPQSQSPSTNNQTHCPLSLFSYNKNHKKNMLINNHLTQQKMQHLLNKLNFQFGTSAAAAEAYSPFNKEIHDINNRRSKMFPDRRRIPGRKTKYILVIAYLIHVYAVMKLAHARRIYNLKVEQQRSLQRRSSPYFQSLTDIEYSIQKRKLDLILKQSLGEEFLKTSNFHDNSFWIPNRHQIQVWTGAGLWRSPLDIPEQIFNTYLPGFNIQNI